MHHWLVGRHILARVTRLKIAKKIEISDRLITIETFGCRTFPRVNDILIMCWMGRRQSAAEATRNGTTAQHGIVEAIVSL